MATKRKTPSRRWHSPYSRPDRDGWYEVLAPDNRWDGQPNWRLWKDGCWWKETESIGFTAYVNEPRFRWRGEPKSTRLRYAQVAGKPDGDGGCK